MSTITETTERVKTGRPIRPRPGPRKPLQPAAVSFAWVRRPILPCEIAPAGIAGLLYVGDDLYTLGVIGELPDEGPPVVRGWRLQKANGSGEPRDIDGLTWRCDCPDAEFRPERPGPNGHGSNCKHAVNVRRALAAIALEEVPCLIDPVTMPDGSPLPF